MYYGNHGYKVHTFVTMVTIHGLIDGFVPQVMVTMIHTPRLISLPKGWNKSGCYVTITKHGVGRNADETKKSTVDRSGGLFVCDC